MTQTVLSTTNGNKRPARQWIIRILSVTVGLAAVAALTIFALLYWQGSRKPATDGEYIALGSSFAAGIGLGPRAPGSPVHCFRTTAGYPALVARRTGLRFVDMSCSGSTSEHILDGGQLLLGPQLSAVGPQAQLVTITSGGNDVGYIGDLMAASGGIAGLAGWLNGPARPAADRPYDRVTAKLEQIVREVRIKAPSARIVLVSYPAILPEQGNCAATGVSDAQAQISRDVAARLAAATRRAADEEDALLIDMAALSKGHDVCSQSPWVNGAEPAHGTAFHPNTEGSAAVAAGIIEVLGR